MNTGRRVPSDLDAEEALLGSMLLSKAATTDALDAGVTAESFWKPAHRDVYTAIVEVFATGAQPDPVTVAANLNGVLEGVGGISALRRLEAATPASMNAAHYANQIIEAHRRRAAITIGTELQEAAYEGDLDSVLTRTAEAARGLASGTATTGRRVRLRRGNDIVPTPVSFAWDPWIPLGNPTLIVGEPGLGKSTLVLWVCAGLTRGTLPGAFLGTPARVLVWSGEDSPETTLIPRLRAAGADLDFVEIVTITEDGLEDGLTLPRDLDALEAAITNDTALLMVDPFMAALEGSIDSYKDQSVRRAIAPLFRLADRQGIGVAIVAHTNKSTSGSFVQRVGGSVGLSGAVRSAMLVGHDPERPEVETARLLAHAKHNLSPEAASQRFDVVGAPIETEPPIETAMIRWGEMAPHLTAEDLLRGPATDRPTRKRDAAKEMLLWMLADGGAWRSDIHEEAGKQGISWRTVETAKREIGAADRQIPQPGKRGAGPSWWYLPEHAALATNGAQASGPQDPAVYEIADHSVRTQAAPVLGSHDRESNVPQGGRSRRVGIAEHSEREDDQRQRLRDAAAEHSA